MKQIYKYFSNVNTSLIRKLRIVNTMSVNIIMIIFTAFVYTISYTYQDKLIETYSAYHVTRVRHAIESEMTKEVNYILSVANSSLLIEWYKDPSNMELASLVVKDNSRDLNSLIKKDISATILKERKSLLLEPRSYVNGEIDFKEIAFSKERVAKDKALIESSYHDYILTMNSNAITGINNLWFTAGVYDEGEFLGTLSFSVNFEKIANHISDLNLDIIDINLVDSDGYIKSSSSIDYRYLWEFDNTNIIDELDDPEFTKYFSKISDSNDLYIYVSKPEVFTVNYQDQKIILSALPIGSTPWSVIIMSDTSDLYECVQNKSIILYLIGIYMMLYVLFNISSGVLLKKPFKRFIESLYKFKNDKTVEIYGINRPDEIGFLANTFKELSTQLIENNLELERTVSKRTEELKYLNIELASNQNRLKKLFNSLPLGIITFNSSCEFVSCNDYALSLFELENYDELKEIFETKLETIQMDKNYKEYLLSTRTTTFEPMQRELKTKSSKFFWADIRILYVPSSTPENDLFDMFVSNITKVKNNELELKKKAYIDELTGLNNRRYLDDYLARFFTNSENEGVPITMIILDIDNFKKINDKFGHDIGDVVLKNLSDILKNTVRNTEIVTRWGGEEFVVLLPNADLKSGEALAERLRRKVATSDFIEVQNVTITLGVAQRSNTESVEEWFKRADQALYLGKNSNKNVVKVSII